MATGVGEMGVRGRTGVLALLVAVVMVVAACGGGSSKRANSANGPLQNSSADAGPGSTIPQGVSGGSGSSSSSTTAGRPSTKGGSGSTGGPAQPGGGQVAGGPAPVPPGTYGYAQTGTYEQAGRSGSVPSDGTLVVDPAANGTQVWHRFVSTTDNPADSTVLFSPSGMFIESVVERFGGVDVTCTFGPPLPSPPWPPSVGKTFSTQGNCSGSGVTATIHVDGGVSGTDSLPLDGQNVNVYVANATITIDGTYQGASIRATDAETDWFAPSLRLPVKSHSKIDAQYAIFKFSADTTSTLKSGRPS